MSHENTIGVLRGIVVQLDSNIRDLREAQRRANEVACKRLGSEIVGIKIARACVVDEIERLEGK